MPDENNVYRQRANSEACSPDGIPEPKVLGIEDAAERCYMAETLRSLLPTAERVGVPTAAEVQIESLVERLRLEAVKQHACVMPAPFVGAWTTVA